MAYGQPYGVPTGYQGAGYTGYPMNGYAPYTPPRNDYTGYMNGNGMNNGQMGVGQNMSAQQPMNNATGMSSASRIVTSKEESIAIPADFSGAPMVFPDITHNRVYVKRWDFNSGSAQFVEYAPVQPQQDAQQAQGDATPKAPSYATVDAVNGLQDYVTKLEKDIEILENEVSRLKKPAPQQNRQYRKKERVDDE